ncbi:hypothetical protein CBOS2020_00320 [Clostridium botulinum]|nr:hypothetical protein CBOS2020_00320 [Clostridium botulinum]
MPPKYVNTVYPNVLIVIINPILVLFILNSFLNMGIKIPLVLSQTATNIIVKKIYNNNIKFLFFMANSP